MRSSFQYHCACKNYDDYITAKYVSFVFVICSIRLSPGAPFTNMAWWTSNHLHGKVWYEIGYPFQSFNGPNL